MKYILIFLSALFILPSCSSRSATGNKNMQAIITGITIRQLEFTDASGMAWDSDGSGPDVRAVLYSQGSNAELFASPVANNIRPVNLPVTWSMRDYNEAINGKQLRLVLFDIDDNNTRQEMKSWNFDGNVTEGNIMLGGGDNSVYQVEIMLEYRPIQ